MIRLSSYLSSYKKIEIIMIAFENKSKSHVVINFYIAMPQI